MYISLMCQDGQQFFLLGMAFHTSLRLHDAVLVTPLISITGPRSKVQDSGLSILSCWVWRSAIAVVEGFSRF